LDSITTEIVGEQERYDQREVTFTRAEQGKLGDRVKDAWFQENAKDPYRKLFFAYSDNCLGWRLHAAVNGPVLDERVPFTDPQSASRAVKSAARFLGADLVGITTLDPAYVYSHRGRTGAQVRYRHCRRDGLRQDNDFPQLCRAGGDGQVL